MRESARIIKKYPNRRLYDTGASCYVTLADLRQLVLDGAPFVVRAARTGADLTQNVLLQIVADAELQGPPLLSDALLRRLIQTQATDPHTDAAARLERCLDITSAVPPPVAANPLPHKP